MNSPSGLTEIGESCFESCQNLRTSNIPSTVKQISKSAIKSCTHLEEIVIVASVTSIGLRTVDLPHSVTSIDSTAFLNCNNLANFSVNSENAVFSSHDGVWISVDNSESTLVKYPHSKGEDRYSIPDGISHISPYAFAHNLYLHSIDIPSSIKKIGIYI